ncbi:MAG: bifunctional 4'-phosphopantothenoylcysteine decarboxylase/phosphopantothenoylcysteine synthetase, partial [Chloroflexota bacterium]|nr:bifunctional 4'-phosphopantothenoylcysteine decarboxylase/phosphopantothenoylcysteine synthetase [Chloroflexota bacterium]
AGADVTRVSGPTARAAPAGTRVVRVETAAQMGDAVLVALPDADAVVMAAAVADYRPAEARTLKLKKRDAGGSFGLAMVENADVLRAIVAARRPGTVVVGFKAETGDPAAEAEHLLREKGVDLVVANDVSQAGSEFGSDTDRVWFVSHDGTERLDLMPKSEVARRLVARIAELLAR